MTYLLTQMMLYMLCALILGVILGWLFWGRLSTQLRNCQADRAKLSAELKSRGDNSVDQARIEKLEAELASSNNARNRLQDEVETLRSEASSNQNNGAGLAAGTAAPLAAVASEAAETSEAKETSKPEGLSAARNGKPDDLKLIKGVGPKLERMLNELGYFHFDQIARWSPSEAAWIDSNIEGFPGRASRDNWMAQARILASGGETEFSARNS